LQSQLATRSPAALAALLIASVLPGGCIGTPLPEPPNFSPQTGLGVDPMRAGCLDCDHFFLRIFGAPGTVSPDATLIVTRIDRDLPPSLHAPAADGSFDLTLMLSPYEELRLEAGARRELVVTAPPSPSEDLLLFESSTPFDRRIVTVRAR
jgi:hypothetical protein